MSHYIIDGAGSVKGSALIQGSKNATLPLIAAALLVEKGSVVLKNVPVINDVMRAVELCQELGAEVLFDQKERVLVINAESLSSSVLKSHYTKQFRGSVLFMPPVMHRMKEVTFEGAGGCRLGTRNLDFHYRGFARLGAHVDYQSDYITIEASDLKSSDMYLDMPSHTGTENLIMAACLVKGKSTITNASSEPEVNHLIDFLNKMGARIYRESERIIHIEGVERLSPIEWTVMPDRMDTGFFSMLATIAGGSIDIIGGDINALGVAKYKLEQMGTEFHDKGAVTHVSRTRPLKPINVITDAYPGFATDLQSLILAVSTQCDGVSYIHEKIYDGRFSLVDELKKMGADIDVDGQRAIINAPNKLTGTDVIASDLRTGAALILAAVVAEGETKISNIYMINRGYQDMCSRLQNLGVNIRETE